MGIKVEIPENATVLICGPSCSGKSTLARKILDEYKGGSKELISADVLMEEFMQTHETALKDFKRISGDCCALKLYNEEYSGLLVSRIIQALQSKDLAVIEGIFVEESAIKMQMLLSRIHRGIAPFVLICLRPNQALNREFYQRREVERRLPWSAIVDERKCFEAATKVNYTNQTMLPLRQYIISDPREVELHF